MGEKKWLILIAALAASSLMPGCKPVLGWEAWSFLSSEEPAQNSKEDAAFSRCEATEPQDATISHLVIFGDSLSDTNKFKRRLQMNPEYPFFSGRFSNGPIWNDYLARCANLQVDNFSQGGAVTKANVGEPTEELFGYIRDVGRSLAIGSINQFVDEYLKEHNHLIPHPDKTLFVIWAGANDYLTKFDNSEDLTTMIDEPDTPHKGGNAIARMSAKNIGDEIRKLYESGARSIVIANMPDLGLIPAVRSNKNYLRHVLSDDARRYRLSAELSRITRLHNKLLAEEVAIVKQSLDDDQSKIAIFDAAQALKNLLDNKGPHGEKGFDFGIDLKSSFSELSVPGKVPLRIGQKCYLGGYLGSDDARKVCHNASKMLFWDEIHPTSAGHCGIAYFLHAFLNDQNIIKTKASIEEYKRLCK